MKIKRFSIFRLAIPFSLPISHNLAQRQKSDALLIMAESEEGLKGYGEGTPRPYVTGEDLDSCIAAANMLCQGLTSAKVETMKDLESLLDEKASSDLAQANPSAFCAMELSLLDLWGRTCHKPLWRLFARTPVQESFSYSAVIPMLGGPALDKLLEAIKGLKMHMVKVKVSGLAAGVDYVRHIRNTLGTQADIRVDANGAFSAEQSLEFLEKTRDYNISAFEQPVPKDDLNGMKTVTELGNVPVLADESICTAMDIKYLVENRICSGFNIRLSKCKGFRNSLRFWRYAKQNGFICQMGCHVGETAVLAAAGRHFATICEKITFLEGSFSRFVLVHDLSRKGVTFGMGGRATSIHRPGLGIDIDESALACWGKLVAEVM